MAHWGLKKGYNGQTAGWALVERVPKTRPQGCRFAPSSKLNLDKELGWARLENILIGCELVILLPITGNMVRHG